MLAVKQMSEQHLVPCECLKQTQKCLDGEDLFQNEVHNNIQSLLLILLRLNSASATLQETNKRSLQHPNAWKTIPSLRSFPNVAVEAFPVFTCNKVWADKIFISLPTSISDWKKIFKKIEGAIKANMIVLTFLLTTRETGHLTT